MVALATLREKLELLRRADRKLTIFGASSHRYLLRDVLAEQALMALEERLEVSLPSDYREFLVELGNGGAGPSYGVFPFGEWDGAGSGLEPWIGKPHVVTSLAREFPLARRWSLPARRFEAPAFPTDAEEDAWQAALDAELYPDSLTRGWFPICHHGCALRTYLVVTGPERGNVWHDARPEQGPVTPHTRKGKRLSFSEWYELWLDTSLSELERAPPRRSG